MRLVACIVAIAIASLGCDKPKPPSPDAGTPPVSPSGDASVPVMTIEPPATRPSTRPA